MADISKNTLPIDVREHLMRGQWDAAINALETVHGLTKDEARKRIREYRATLKERNVELEVMKIQTTYSREAEKEAQQKKVTLMRTLFALVVLAMIILLLTTI